MRLQSSRAKITCVHVGDVTAWKQFRCATSVGWATPGSHVTAFSHSFLRSHPVRFYREVAWLDGQIERQLHSSALLLGVTDGSVISSFEGAEHDAESEGEAKPYRLQPVCLP